MQNERHIRSSLEVTKSLQQRDRVMHVGIDSASEKSLWMTSVVRDELQRPLVISDEEIHKLQADEARVKKMLTKYAQVKLNTVEKLKRELTHKGEYVSSAKAKREQQQKMKDMGEIESKIRNNLKNVAKRRDLIPVHQIPKKIFD